MSNRMPGSESYGSNICFDCALACGKCEWSAVDPVTGRIMYAPVPGWTAKPTILGKKHTGEAIQSFYVTACPKFHPTRKNSQQRHLGAPVRPVIATDVSGEVRIFESVTEASKALCVSTANIYTACSGRAKTAGGYKWRYADAK